MQRLTGVQRLLLSSLIFGLFFGAGNLIFPVQLGRAAGAASPLATLGFLITAVGLPVAALVAAALSGSRSVADVVAPVSRRYSIGFTVLLYLTIGPAFAIPRTATVSFEVGVRPLLPAASARLGLLLFTVVFFGITGFVAMRPTRLLDSIGRYLTPTFLVLLAALVVGALVMPMSSELGEPTGAYASAPLTTGFLDGYSTMDALAGLAFAIVVVEALHRLGVQERGRVAAEIARAGLLGGIGIAVVYVSLVYVGATSVGAVPEADNGGVVLAAVSRHLFGVPGLMLIAGIVTVACLKTAIGLIVACSEMFVTLTGGRVGYRAWALGFTTVSAVVANAGLETLIAYSVPVLMLLYPLAIVAIAMGIASRWVGHKPYIHRGVTGLTGVAALFDLVKALPEPFASRPWARVLVDFAASWLPGYNIGFGWLVPAVVGLVLGALLERFGRPQLSR